MDSPFLDFRILTIQLGTALITTWILCDY